MAAVTLGLTGANERSVAYSGGARLASAVRAALTPGPDFNGDGFADLVVGIPYEDVGAMVDAGAVQVIYGSSNGLNGDRPVDDQFWTEEDFGLSTISSEPNDHFGFSVASGDFDGDGFDDVAIGVPNQDLSVPGKHMQDAGAVYVLRGSRSGLTDSGPLLTQNFPGVRSDAEPGDHFGWSLTTGDFGRGSMDDLAIGVPDEDIPLENGIKDNSGAVNVLYGSSSGLTGIRSEFLNEYLIRPPLPGRLLGYLADHYGFSLAAANLGRTVQDDLVIGIPYRDERGVDSGMVAVVYGSAVGLRGGSFRQQVWTQDSRGVDGAAEGGDLFGYALAAADFGKGPGADLAIGVPHDGPGDTGTVLVLYSTPTGLSALGMQVWSQGSAQVQGDPAITDEFGYALVAANFGKGPQGDLAIGVPFDKGSVGGVNVLFGGSNGLSAIGNEFLWQDESSFEGKIEGDSERDDQFGAALTAGNFGKGSGDDLAVGVPGEDRERTFSSDLENVGAVNVLYGDSRGLRDSDDQFWWQASDSLHDSGEEGDSFGFALTH